MNPASMIPDPEPLPLPAPIWLVWALLMLTFVLHVVAMNLLVGGSLLAVHARLRHAADVHGRMLVARFVRFAPVLVAATVTFGVAPLLFLQVLYGRLFFVSSILMAWSWLGIVPLIIVVYYGTYWAQARGRHSAAALAVGAAIAVLVAAIGFVYTNNMTLMLRADRWSALYAASGRGLHLNLSDPTVWPRWLHMMLGATAVSGLAAAILGAFQRAAQPEFGAWVCRYGARASAAATALNLAVGAWWMGALPSPVLQRFVADPIDGLVLLVGIVDALACMGLLLTLERRPSVPVAAATAGTMLITIVVMAFTRDAIRTLTLHEMGYAPAAWTAPQWIPIALFFVLLVAALATVGWMVAVFTLQSRTEGA